MSRLLAYLRVNDFALIEDIEVEFKQGLNILTGETGAGKTVLVGAIELLLGGRADSMQVRRGAESARLSCALDLAGKPDVLGALRETGLLEIGEDEVLITRRISEGKSRCTINGRLCPVSALSRIGESLVEIHGQNSHQSLLRVGSHIEYLDRYAGEEHVSIMGEYRERYDRLLSLMEEVDGLRAGAREEGEEGDLLKHEIQEIDRCEVKPGELEELESTAARLRNAKSIIEMGEAVRSILTADGGVTPSVREQISEAVDRLKEMSKHEGEASSWVERMEGLACEAEDIGMELSAYLGGLDSDPVRLEEVTERISAIRRLIRKYGGSVEEVIAYRNEAEEKLRLVEEAGIRMSDLEEQIFIEYSALDRLASRLSSERREAAEELEKAIAREMARLELSEAAFQVVVDHRESRDGRPARDRFDKSGADDVEFLFSPTPGEPAKPLRKIASGGEMSRIMLAIKIVLAKADRIPVLVFDEVDAGIGGETANTVGEKLYQLTGDHQVFCVTHIPQIAVYADWQYAVRKRRGRGSAKTSVVPLRGEEKVEEMCRMLGDSGGRKVTLEHARDILDRANARKAELGGSRKTLERSRD